MKTNNFQSQNFVKKNILSIFHRAAQLLKSYEKQTCYLYNDKIILHNKLPSFNVIISLFIHLLTVSMYLYKTRCYKIYNIGT